MSASTKDLPDPLDSTPVMTVSDPDDLLAQMADEAIDRLMADADKGAMPVTPPVPMAAVGPDAVSAVAAVDESPVVGPAFEVISDTPAALTPEATATVVDNPPVVSAAPAVSPTHASERQALLGDTPIRSAKSSILLLPLRLMNAPFAGIRDDARRLIGLMGIVTLVPSICTFVYLYWLKHH